MTKRGRAQGSVLATPPFRWAATPCDRRNIKALTKTSSPMAADPILLTAGKWLGAASGVLALTTIAGYLSRWGIRFRLVGVTSFTALLAVSCLTFAVSYSPRVQLAGAVSVPVVFDNGIDLVVAAAPDGLADGAGRGAMAAHRGRPRCCPLRGGDGRRSPDRPAAGVCLHRHQHRRRARPPGPEPREAPPPATQGLRQTASFW